MSFADSVGSIARFVLRRLNFEPHPFRETSADEPANAVILPTSRFSNFHESSAFPTAQESEHDGFLGAVSTSGGFRLFGRRLPHAARFRCGVLFADFVALFVE